MTTKDIIKPDFLFEISWEVCNKEGGIHTVLETKSDCLVKEFKDNYILIGPDVWKETRNNPEFIEDKKIFKSWQEYAEKSGLKFRIGRWNIGSKPIVVLVDFSQFIINKDKIFLEFWEKYNLDTINGQWDFFEPALFGYAAGKLIENFWEYNVSANDKIVAHFNQWNCCSGILFLKDRVPQISTIFTTHGTILGNVLAKNNISVSSIEEPLDDLKLSEEYNVKEKHQLEKLAAQNCDCFTTVSSVTSKECSILLKKDVDFVTPNGFDSTRYIDNKDITNKREIARDKLLKIAKAVLKRNFSENTQIILGSGRYETKLKGYDILIKSLGEINKQQKLNREIILFINVPINICGPRLDLQIDNDVEYDNISTDDFLTHWIFNYEENQIINGFIENDLHNYKDDNVKVIYIPTFLNGEDGVINMRYYDLLLGFDLTIFPSFYEPWGYTPLESIAFGVPTITTSKTGFAKWIIDSFGEKAKSITIIDRNSDNDEQAINNISKIIIKFNNLGEKDTFDIKENAFQIAKNSLWNNLISNYYISYTNALNKAMLRFDSYKTKVCVTESTNGTSKFISSEWRQITVKITLPKELTPLQEISKNLWWAWNYKAIELFMMTDPELWLHCEQNPISMLESLSYERCQELIDNKDYLSFLQIVYSDFTNYLSLKKEQKPPKVAYFSMEYGIHDTLKIFSGGLGMLAGDYLKQASDSNVDVVGVGLLYRYGYFLQKISNSGEQIDSYQPQLFSHLPITPILDQEGNELKIQIALPGRTLFAKIWLSDIGRIPLYLLDTDISDNDENDRKITHQLYGGDWDNRLKQEILLGLGGIRILEKINIKPDIYHLNEGHAAFTVIERLKKLMQDSNISYQQATEIIRSSTLFTTHTPVPAGHDAFSEDMLRVYFSHFPARLNISWEAFINLGKMHSNNPNEKFSMSVLAAKLSQEMNGVSRIHGTVTQEMFKDLYQGYFPEELYIDYVTNGVHYPTWTHKKWQQLHKETFGDMFVDDQSNEKYWEKIKEVSDVRLWNLKNELRTEMLDYVRVRLTNDMTQRQENPKLLFDSIDKINNNVLTIGFARRFATYKRAYLLFSDLEKLSNLVNNKEQPLQFIFAGKAHPHDKAGQEVIKRIIEVSKMQNFLGKIIFIENYDMQLAKKLISGCDVWLNTPTRPLEASGTSGEKAIMNGVLNFSVLDGWWAEGYVEGAGWALKEEQTYENNFYQDILDAETIYETIEEEIAPLFYKRDGAIIPQGWIEYIRNNFMKIAPKFTMKRQLDDYYNKFYNKLYQRTIEITKDNYELTSKIAKWKRDITNNWDFINILNVEVVNNEKSTLLLGDILNIEISVDLNSINPQDIGIEIIFAKIKKDLAQNIEIYKKFDLEFVSSENNISKYSCKVPAVNAGMYNYIFRMFPKNKFLPHRQDFDLVRWF